MSLFSSATSRAERIALSIVTEHMREGAILIDKRQQVLFINAAARVILKLGKKGTDSRVIINAFRKKFPSVELNLCFHNAPEKPPTVPEVEADSSIYRIHFSCIAGEEGKHGCTDALIWIEDVTEAKALERRKSEFVSVVAHQLRTPLSGLKWTLHMLINGDLGAMTDEQRTFLMKSYENNERMITLVNDMLAADRVESGRLKYSLMRINLRDLVENTLFELFPSAQRRGISIDFDCPTKERFLVLVDAAQVRAVVQNLLENAIKYTMKGGTVVIKLEVAGKDVQLSVKDSGIGIPKEQQSQIFTRFFRAGNVLTMEPSGSGLGLYMVRKIVEQHGGKVWFESVEGKGSTFFVTFPMIRQL